MPAALLPRPDPPGQVNTSLPGQAPGLTPPPDATNTAGRVCKTMIRPHLHRNAPVWRSMPGWTNTPPHPRTALRSESGRKCARIQLVWTLAPQQRYTRPCHWIDGTHRIDTLNPASRLTGPTTGPTTDPAGPEEEAAIRSADSTPSRPAREGDKARTAYTTHLGQVVSCVPCQRPHGTHRDFQTPKQPDAL